MNKYVEFQTGVTKEEAENTMKNFAADWSIKHELEYDYDKQIFKGIVYMAYDGQVEFTYPPVPCQHT
jgi:hypothetical protein